jgi:hypothetical protein
MFEIAQRVCPIATEAFDEHVRGGVRFSRSEFAALQEVLVGTDESGAGNERSGRDDTEGFGGGSLEARLRTVGERHGIEGRALERFVTKACTGREG